MAVVITEGSISPSGIDLLRQVIGANPGEFAVHHEHPHLAVPSPDSSIIKSGVEVLLRLGNSSGDLISFRSTNYRETRIACMDVFDIAVEKKSMDAAPPGLTWYELPAVPISAVGLYYQEGMHQEGEVVEVRKWIHAIQLFDLYGHNPISIVLDDWCGEVGVALGPTEEILSNMGVLQKI